MSSPLTQVPGTAQSLISQTQQTLRRCHQNYVDIEITNNAADGTETIVTGAGINVVTGDGSTGTPYVITATEAQNLADVIAIDPSAGNSPITDITDPTNRRCHQNYVDNEITNNAADGTETIVTGQG
ncbi:MAG: hypothetical protein ACE37L_14615 [Allomuricauda sp.]